MAVKIGTLLYYRRSLYFKVVHFGLAEWIQHPLLVLEVRGSNPTPSENTTSLPPKLPRGSPKSRAHRRISELNEGGGETPKKD